MAAMSHLIIARHALAEPSGHVDRERDLTQTGHEQAAALGAWLREQKLKVDYAIVSDALRTQQTFSDLQIQCEVLTTDQAYNASAGALAALVRSAPANARCVLLIGHNPGVFDLAAGYGYFGGMTPASAAVCELAGMPAQFGSLHATVTLSFQPAA